MKTRSCLSISAAALLTGICISPIPGHGAEIDAIPTAPTATAFRLHIAPTLDGEVANDPAWRNAQPIEGFWQVRPDDGQPATQRTQVFVGFTDEALYLGVICHDKNPAGIIVTDSRRDASLNDTDSFRVILDTYRDRQNGFVFGTNPAGIEYDGQVTKEGTGQFRSGGGGFNLNWDTTWSVSTSTSQIGWSAEMWIPFKSLRYGAEQIQTWGINFQRNIRRNNEVTYWAPIPRQHNLYRLSRAGSLDGIHVPLQRNLKLTPYVVGKARRGDPLATGTDYDDELGFDLKYSVTPSLTVDASYNTDFAQVEVDNLQINLDRFSLFLPEKRPFFLENAGQFSMGVPREVELFFSRRIGIGPGGAQIPIVAGVRLSGKIGVNTNIGFLQMRSEAVSGVAPRNDYTVGRISRELANRSSVGMLLVNRRGDGSLINDDYNRTYAIDGRWGIGENALIQGFIAKTDTPGLSSKDHAFNIAGNYDSEKWSYRGGYTEVSRDFNPEVGFLARRNYRKVDAFVMRRYRPANLWGLHEMRPHITYRSFWDLDDFHETEFIHLHVPWEWKSGMEINTAINFTLEGVKDEFDIVDGVTVPPGNYDHHELSLGYRTNQSAPLSFRINATIGGFFGGDRVSVTPRLRYRIGETFNTELSWEHNDIDLPVPGGNFNLNLLRLRVSYSFTPRISLQGLIQYNDRDDVLATNLRFAWLQSANTGLYLVYNEVDDSSPGSIGGPRRELILKYSRILDLLN